MDFHSPLEIVAMSYQSPVWGLKIIALIQMSTYYYLSLEDSHSQLDQDLREAGPSRTFSLTALSSSEPNVPVPEPEREKRLEPEPEKRPEFSVPEVT